MIETTNGYAVVAMNNGSASIDPVSKFDDDHVCTNCDYRLKGLPAGAACPECGTNHPIDLFTLRGWRNPPMATWGRGQATRAAQAAIVVYLLIVALGVCYAIFKGQGGDALHGATILIIGIALALFLNLRPPAGRPPMRLRIAAGGYELRRGPGPLSLNPWQAAYPAKIRALGRDYAQISVGWKDPMHSSSNALQFCWRCDAATAERLRQTIDGFTQPLKVNSQRVYSQLI